MSSKKRAKSAPDDSHPHGKRSSNGGETSPFAWTHAGVQVLLPSGRRLAVVGRGTLSVQSGEIDVYGRVLSASSGAVELSGDADNGGAVPIEVVSTEARVPFAGSGGAAFSIASSRPGASGAASSQAQHSFNVYLADDPGAPGALAAPQDWQHAAAELATSIAGGGAAGAPPALVAVAGPKKVGKSSFCRYLINTLLNSHPCVAFLETDCGQPEFTPPGLLSLHLLTAPVLGAPHLRLRPPQAAHFLGDLSPQCDPRYHVACVASLHRWLLARPGGRPPPPLVVNTGGWVRGLGLDVLGDTLRALPVTHFVSLASANPGRNLPLGPFWGAPGEPPPRALLWQVPGAQEAAAARPPPRQLAGWGAAPAYSLEGGDDAAPGAGRAALSAVEQRALQWAAFAQACAAAAAPPAAAAAAGPPPGGEQPELAAAPATPGDQLAAAVPFVVDLAVLEVHVLHGAASPAELPRVLNGAVVGLCRAAGAPPGAPLPCLGLGVVRAVDAAAGRAYVLTDVEEDALQAVDTLQVGRLELPPALLQTGGALSPYLALFSLATAGTGAGANKSRNNLQRAGQL